MECQTWLDDNATGKGLLKNYWVKQQRDSKKGYVPKFVRGLLLNKPVAAIDDWTSHMYQLCQQPGLQIMTDPIVQMFYTLAVGGWQFDSPISVHAKSSIASAVENAPGSKYLPVVEGIQLLGQEEGSGPALGAESMKMIFQLFLKAIDDNFDQSIPIRTSQDRFHAIALNNRLFCQADVPGYDSFLPRVLHPYKDIAADASQVMIARCGIGQLFLKASSSPGSNEIVCDTMDLHKYKVRSGFRRLGACAHFSVNPVTKEWALKRIELGGTDGSDDRVQFYPPTQDSPTGNKRWEHAKFVWRCSLFTYTTAVYHLMWSHWLLSNSWASSVSEKLSPRHPIRRLLQIFAYNTIRVNETSHTFLFRERGALHRMSPFPFAEHKKILEDGAKTYKFRTWETFSQEMKLPHDEQHRLPMFEDGLPVFRAFRDFFQKYVSLYYGSDASVKSDPELVEYWKFDNVPQMRSELPELSKDALINQMAQAVFDATAFHNFVGSVAEYTTDPAGAFFQVRDDRASMCDMRQMILVNSLVATTGTPMPKLIAREVEGDMPWVDQLNLGDPVKYGKIKGDYDEFMTRLYEISEQVKRRNRTREREHAFSFMDPVEIPRSTSV
jgi:hypothetical protein